VSAITLPQLSVVLGCVGLGAAGGVMLKAGAVHVDYGRGVLAAARQGITEPLLLGGLLLYAVPVVAYIVLLKTVPLSVLQPVLALTYVVAPLLALALGYEHVPPLRWVGIAVIMLGVVIVARS
jgi:drug/metabolite transporter (DMT)-like permease